MTAPDDGNDATQAAARRDGRWPARLRAGWSRRSLGLRLAVLLSLALLPLGLLAIDQTSRLQSELARVNDLNFQALTAEIARREASATARAAGVARGLADTLPALAAQSVDTCIESARRLVDRSDGALTYVGHAGTDMVSRCNSTGRVLDLGDDDAIRERMTRPGPAITASPSGRISGVPVISIHRPAVAPGGGPAGHVTLSLAARDIALPEGVAGRDLRVAMVDGSGAVLGATRSLDALERALPSDFTPSPLSGGAVFSATDRDGLRRDYAVEPIVSGAVYAVGIRPAAAADGPLALPPAIYPLAMWLASIALVLGMIELSLIGPVRALGARIRVFGETRTLPPLSERARLPPELAGIDSSFTEVATKLRRDEARLIDALHDQEVLLKEVHHRVKNNLQVISSMINLQARGAETAETETELARINARIASLATVHRRLYESQHMRHIRFDLLLRDIVDPLAEGLLPGTGHARDAPVLSFDLAPVALSPDQAVPGAMFAVEAVTNALEHSRPDAQGRRWIALSLACEATPDMAEDPAADTALRVELTVRSSGTGPPEADAAPGAPGTAAGGRRRLGRRLIEGFARQVSGVAETGWQGATFVARLRFEVKAPAAAAPP